MRPLTRLLGAEGSQRVIGVDVNRLHLGHLHDRGKPVIQEGRIILLAVDASGILVQGLAHSSHNAPFKLAFHQHGVDRLTAVMGGDHLDHRHFPRLRIHFHLCRLGHEGIVGAEIPVFGEE